MSAKIIPFRKRQTVDGEYYTLASGNFTTDNIIGHELFKAKFKTNSYKLAELALHDALGWIQEQEYLGLGEYHDYTGK